MPKKKKPLLPPIESVQAKVIERDARPFPKKANPFQDNPCLVAYADTDYDNRPIHRGHTVEVQAWSDLYGMLVIRSDDRTNEALVTPEQLRQLADALEQSCLGQQ
jgi:hypothetical protein